MQQGEEVSIFEIVGIKVSVKQAFFMTDGQGVNFGPDLHYLIYGWSLLDKIVPKLRIPFKNAHYIIFNLLLQIT